MCTRLHSKVFPHVVFSDDEFEIKRPATPSDAPGQKRLKAPSRLGLIVADDRALSPARSLFAALDEEKRSLRWCSSISASANAGTRAPPRGQHVALVARADAQGRAWHEGARPRRCGGEAEGGQVLLVEGTPMNREKSGRPGDSLASGQDNACGTPKSSLLVESMQIKAKVDNGPSK
jgi:hypothetical protein